MKFDSIARGYSELTLSDEPLNPLVPFMHSEERTLEDLEKFYSFQDIQGIIYEKFSLPIISIEGVPKINYGMSIHNMLKYSDSIDEIKEASLNESLDDVILVARENSKNNFTTGTDYGPFKKYIK